MRQTVCLILFGALVGACATPGSGGWVRAPQSNEFATHYPPAALDAGIEGNAIVECEVGDDGRLHTCAVLEEAPAGHGFGEAALRLTTYFRIAPSTRDGVATAGGRVRVPIRFSVTAD